MLIAILIVSGLLVAAIVWSAVRKLSGEEAVVHSYARAGVPESRLKHLAVILFAAAAGLLLGLLWRPIAIAASAGLVIYFAIAIGFHIRHRDAANLSTPAVLAVVSAGLLVLHIASS